MGKQRGRGLRWGWLRGVPWVRGDAAFSIPSIPGGGGSPGMPRVPGAAGGEQGCGTRLVLGMADPSAEQLPGIYGRAGTRAVSLHQHESITPGTVHGLRTSPCLLRASSRSCRAARIGRALPLPSGSSLQAAQPGNNRGRESPAYWKELPGMQRPRGFCTRIPWSCGRAMGFPGCDLGKTS